MQNLDRYNVSLRSITLLIGVSCGFLVANIYYAQPLIGLIAEYFGVTSSSSSLIVTLQQLGYGLGLFFIVPLADLINNKRLVLFLILTAFLSLLGFAIGQDFVIIMGCAFFVGLASSAVQILVPYAAYLAPETVRGRVVGNVMSGLMAGIMLARPLASALASLGSWQTVFYFSAAVLVLLFVMILLLLPRKVPVSSNSYSDLLHSMLQLWQTYPTLRRRAFYHACLFCAFSMFWTIVPLFLMSEAFSFSQREVALFALAGAAGVFAAPIAGRWADRGLERQATLIAMLLVGLCFVLCLAPLMTSSGGAFLLVIAAIALDFGVTTNLVVGQKIIYGLGHDIRSRLNGLYMVVFFIGGAAGSAIGGFAYNHFSWIGVVALGGVLSLSALLYFLTEKRTVNHIPG